MKSNWSKRAFTLIELLLVMGIILMLLTLSLGSISAWKSQKLNAQARQLASEFKYAAMLAQTENFPIEFRIYLLEDELATAGSEAPRAYQLTKLSGFAENSKEPIYKMMTEVRFFEDDIILHTDSKYSSIITETAKPPTSSDPLIRGEQRRYYSFYFLPNGTTSLERRPDSVFTLVKESELPSKTELPPNYRSVVLQPITSNATVF